VVPVANAVMISGFVDQPEHIARVIRIAEEYYPKGDQQHERRRLPAGVVCT